MGPQTQSILTSILMTISTSAATWATAHGIIPSADQTSAANILVAVALWIVTAALAWWKKRAVSQTSMIQAVNAADNGVKVVPTNATPIAAVSAPLKGPEAPKT